MYVYVYSCDVCHFAGTNSRDCYVYYHGSVLVGPVISHVTEAAGFSTRQSAL